jgi:hypothetical protein
MILYASQSRSFTRGGKKLFAQRQLDPAPENLLLSKKKRGKCTNRHKPKK